MPVAASCNVSPSAKILYPELVNLYGCSISEHVFIGPFVEIQKNVSVGARSRVQSHAFICEGVCIGERVFIGHGVIFINDRHPVANNNDWVLEKTVVADDVSIGSGAIIMCGITIGAGAKIGAGAVVTKTVAAGETVIGMPARPFYRGKS